MHKAHPQRSMFTRVAVVAAAATLAVTALAPGQAGAAVAHTTSGNPLAGHPMGVYTATTGDNVVYQHYASATGSNKQLLARIALRSRAQWFIGSNNDRIQKLVSQYIANVQGGNSSIIAPLVAFGIPKWEAPIAQRHFTPDMVSAYHDWVNKFAAGVGSSRVMIVLQPDLIYATNNNYSTAVPLAMVRYAAQKFGALRNATVYLDAGARDFTPANKKLSMVSVLRDAGIQYTRGFSLNDTHHDSTNAEIGYGNTLAAGLAKAKLPNHFVINTSSNGQPSTVDTLKTNTDAPACASMKQTKCLALGIPPTTTTNAAYWGITAANKAIAARLVDAYIWVDRPWITNQSSGGTIDVNRSLTLGRATPFVAFTTKSPTSGVSFGSVSTRAPAGSTRKSIVIRNGSTTQNMTVDSVFFTSVSSTGRWSNALSSTCRMGAVVAPGKSCTATVLFSPVKAGSASAYLHIATNTNNEVYRHLVATVTP